MSCETCELQGTSECTGCDAPKITKFQAVCAQLLGIILSAIFGYLCVIATCIDFLTGNKSKRR